MNLDELRRIIDGLNEEIIALLSKRLEVTQKIAQVKKENKLPIDDPPREEEQRVALRELAKKQNLSPAVIEEMFAIFIHYSKLKMKMEVGHAKENRLPGN